jgi:hypothetical protein
VCGNSVFSTRNPPIANKTNIIGNIRRCMIFLL